MEQHTALINRIRGLLSELGLVLPLKAATVRREAHKHLERGLAVCLLKRTNRNEVSVANVAYVFDSERYQRLSATRSRYKLNFENFGA